MAQSPNTEIFTLVHISNQVQVLATSNKISSLLQRDKLQFMYRILGSVGRKLD